MKAISSDVQVTQIRPASRRGSRGGIPVKLRWLEVSRPRVNCVVVMIQCDALNTSEWWQSSLHEKPGCTLLSHTNQHQAICASAYGYRNVVTLLRSSRAVCSL